MSRAEAAEAWREWAAAAPIQLLPLFSGAMLFGNDRSRSLLELEEHGPGDVHIHLHHSDWPPHDEDD